MKFVLHLGRFQSPTARNFRAEPDRHQPSLTHFFHRTTPTTVTVRPSFTNMVFPCAPWLERFSRHRSPSQKHKSRSHKKGDTREMRPNQQCFPPPEPYPWLVYFNHQGEYNHTFCSMLDPTKTYTISVPAEVETGKRKSSSMYLKIQHGWCLHWNSTSKYVSQLVLCNPCNLEKIKLPPFKHKGFRIGDCILSSSPTATDQVCSIFIFSFHTTSIFYCQIGDEQWTKVDYHEDIVNLLASSLVKYTEHVLRDPVYCNGCLYAKIWTCFGYTLVVIEKLQPYGLSFNSTPILMPKLPPPVDSDRYCLSQCLCSNKELFQIEILHAKYGRVSAVAVHRFNCSLWSWEKVESIKDAVFFISNTYSPFACQAINPETEGGRIYIALGCKIIVYSIEDKSLMIYQQPFSMRTIRWIMPDIRMIDTLKEEIGKGHQFREKESICGAIHLKETEDKALNESALPLDVVEVIANCLNDVCDYLHFRATNRLFRLASPPVQWRSSSSSSMSLSRFDDLSLSPLFVFSEKDNGFTFVHPKHGLKYKYIINLPKVNEDGEFWNLKSDCEICYSKDGWLLLLAVINTRFSFLFFNPFTKQVLPLAYNPGIFRNTRCVGFSHPPSSSECVIVELYQHFKMKAHIISPGDHEWNLFTFENRTESLLYNISPAFHNGLFYYLGIKGELAVIEVTGGEPSWIDFEEPQAPCTDYLNSFLVECDGNLLSVFEGPDGKWVQVFKWNESTKTWIKVESLENNMLFVGHTSFSAVANIPGMENKIYFPRFYEQNIVFYSLETNNYHTFENEVVNFRHVREQLYSSWIEPRWH